MNDYRSRIGKLAHDRRDPHPFLTLMLDRSVPIEEDAKGAVLEGMDSRFRQFALPFIRPLARTAIILLQIAKTVLPGIAAPRLLHKLLHWGLAIFVRPQANWLILRHFHIGSELLAFIKSNVPEVGIVSDPLKPQRLVDLEDNVFLRHDLNLFNFVIDLSRGLRERGLELSAPAQIDWSAISDGPFPIEEPPARWCNVIDLESAIELFTPIYQLLLTDRDFWRAANSLQLDETIGIYVATICNDTRGLWLINNRHPLVPESTLRAGHRLMLHGLAAECLHYALRQRKRAALARQTESADHSL